MRTLIIYRTNDSPGKRDASCVFVPEAAAFAKIHGVEARDILGYEVKRGLRARWNRRWRMGRDLRKRAGRGYEMVAFFGHGTWRGSFLGWNRATARRLAKLLAGCCVPSVRVVLYACSTAENQIRDRQHDQLATGCEGGFADTLRDEMDRVGFAGFRIDAHKTPGHATYNPYVVRFTRSATRWLVHPDIDRPRWQAWHQALRGSLRLRFPAMTIAEVAVELDKCRA